MANNVTGAELNPILTRINNVPEYHPFETDAFSDWSMEAGDMVTMVRDGTEYKSPVHTSRMVWKGKAPTMQMSATGNEKRDAVARVSRKKYGRGSAGLRSNEQIHRDFTSEDGILHSELHMTESYLRTEFVNEVGSLRGEFEVTASGLRTEFTNEVSSLRGEFEVTASGLRTEFTNEVSSLRGEFEVTASGLRTEFTNEVSSLRGEFEVTASGLRTEFTNEVNSLRGEFEVTASGLRTEFTNEVSSLRGEFEITASGLRTEFTNEVSSLRGEFEVTASGLRTEFTNEVSSLRGEFEVTASGLRTEFTNEVSSLRGEFEVTASGLRTEFTNEVSSLRGEFEVTASGLFTSFSSEVSSVRTDFEVTSSGLNTRVSKVVDENGTIKSAQICVAINEDNSSQAVIEADKIYLLGQTIANTIDANYINAKIGAIPTLNGISASFSGNVTASGAITASGLYIGSSAPYKSVGSGVSAVRINGPTNNIYKLQYKTYDDDTWTDAEGSFSRATTLTGAWGSGSSAGKLTVTASPQDETFIRTISHGIPYMDDQDSDRWKMKITAFGPGTNPQIEETGHVVVLQNYLQTKTGANKITENGTYTPGTGYIGFSEIEIDVTGGGGGTTTISTSWTNTGVLTITTSPQTATEKRYLKANAATWSNDIATIPIESTYGNSQQYSEGIVFSPTLDVSSKLTSARNAASAAVTLLDPVADSKPNGQIDNNRTFTVSTTGRKNSSGSTENLDKSVPLHLYWDGSFSSNVATVYMKWGATPGSSGTNYAKATVDASTIVTNAGYAGRAAVTISDTLTWTTNPGENITVNQNAVTVKTTGRTDSSGNGGDANQSSKTLNFYSNVGSWGTPSANKCYVYVTYGDSANTSRVIRREVDATARYRAGMQAVNLGDYTVDEKSSGINDNRTFTVSTTGRLKADGTADNISKNVPLHLVYDGTFSSNVATVYLQSGTSGTSGTNYAKITVNATSRYRAGMQAVNLGDYTVNSRTTLNDNRTFTISTTGRLKSDGTADNISKSIPLHLVYDGTFSSNVATVYLQSGTSGTSGINYAKVTVDASTIYENGWKAYYNKLKWPEIPAEADLTNVFSVKRPNATVGSAADAEIRNYTLANKDNNTVYLRRSSQTYAEFTHGKYDAGWGAARTSVVGKTYTVNSKTYNYTPTAAVAAADRLQYIKVAIPNTTVGGALTAQEYWLSSGNDECYIRAGSSSGNIVAKYAHNKYTAGRNAVTIGDPAWSTSPGTNISVDRNTATFSTNAPTQQSKDLKIIVLQGAFSSHKKYVYVHQTSEATGNRIARVQVDATNEYNAGKTDATPDEVIYLSRASGNAMVNVRCRRNGELVIDRVLDISGFITGHNVGFTYTNTAGSTNVTLSYGRLIQAGGAGVYDTTRTWFVPSAGLRSATGEGSAHAGTLTANSYVELYYLNHDNSEKGTGITWKVPGSSTPSYAVSGISAGSCPAGDISTVLQGYTMYQTSGVPNSAPSTFRYIKFTVDGKKRAIYFS